MRTTLILKDELINEALRVTAQTEKTAVIHLALEALIEKAAREALIRLGGKASGFKKINRERSR
jgi:Arc/MetJ family transcription regulator